MFPSLWSSSPTLFVINVKLVAVHSNSYINGLCYAMSYALALFHTLNMLSIESETAKGMDFGSLKFGGLWALFFFNLLFCFPVDFRHAVNLSSEF